jgi:hypothetical protein
MKQAFKGVVYDSDSAVLLARNEHQSCIETLKTGHKNLLLFRSPKGRYFKYEKTVSYFADDDEGDPELTPLSAAEAMILYHRLSDQQLPFKDAFPDAEFDET